MNIDHNEFKNKELIVRKTIVSFPFNGLPEFFDKLYESHKTKKSKIKRIVFWFWSGNNENYFL